MKSPEELLKEEILSNYKSIREFTEKIGMPYSTVDSILKRGVRNSSVDKLIKVCDSLGISTDALVEGRISKKSFPPQTVAAHFDGSEFTDEQLQRIKAFARFIKTEDNNKRK